MVIQVQHNQSLIDIAVQEYGSALAVFDLGFANGISITDNLTPGQKITLPKNNLINDDVANYFAGRGQKIATSISAELLLILNQTGIGFMEIENNFEVTS